MRSRFVARLLASVVLLSVVLVGCGDATVIPAATSANTPTATTPAGTVATTSGTAASVSGTVGLSGPAPAAVRLDYAYYNPSSLVLKKFGWLEQDLGNVPVTWTLSLGSNKANEFVSSNSIDFGSTAGAAALLARANGVPLKTVYVYSKPEWTALLVGKNSTLTKVSELKGKKVAVTRGTDPFFFLLRALNEVGLTQNDVEIVNLQHPDGRLALQRGQVDAWAGLDPHMAAAELEDGSKIIYRNIDFNSYGVLNVREDFAQKYPDYVKKVIADYERARLWILQNPDQAAQILSDAAQIKIDVAKRELVDRTVLDKDVGTPGDAQNTALKAVVPILTSEKLVTSKTDPAVALSQLFDPSFAKAVIPAK